MPITPFMGVRSSWLTIETKALFICPTARFSVTSRTATIDSRCAPSRTSLTASSMGKVVPSARRPNASGRAPATMSPVPAFSLEGRSKRASCSGLDSRSITPRPTTSAAR